MAQIAHHPEVYTLALEAREMDELVEMLRIFERDFEVSQRVSDLRAAFEEAYNGERAGGRLIDLKAILGDRPLAGDQEDDEEGGAAVA